MTGHGQKLSRNQERAIAALLSYPSVVEIARSIRVGEKSFSTPVSSNPDMA